MKKFLVLLIALFSIYSAGYCQPANDDCTGATPISLPTSGTDCVTGTTVGATSTTWTSSECGHTVWTNDVWFTFVSTGTINTVIVSPTGSPAAQKLGVSIFTGICDTLASAPGSCAVSTTNGGIDTASYPAPVGTVMYIEVSSFGTAGNFQLCVNSSTPPAAPGNRCSTATHICTASPFTLSNVPPGGSTFTPDCFGANTPAAGQWYQFTVGVTGQLAWTCTPTTPATVASSIFLGQIIPGNGVELDWAIYDITNGCPTNANQNNEVACNFNFEGENSYPIGMSSASGTTCPTNANPGTRNGELCPSITVTAGKTYALFINNFTNNIATGWNFNFNNSTFVMGPVDTFLVSPDTICGSTGTVNITNNSISAIWQKWNFGDGTSSLSAAPGTHTYGASGTYFISLIDSSLSGCTVVSSKSVLIAAYPTVTVPNQSVCPGGAGTLTATPSVPGGTYLWSTGATTASITASPATTSTYTVTYTSAVGCSATATASITVNNSPTATITPANTTVCPGSPTTITASAGTAYIWSDGETTAAITVSPVSTTTYNVTVTVSGGCTATASGTVTVSNNFTTSITPASATICPSASTTLAAGAGNAYLWSNGSTAASITVSPASTTTYTVTVTSGTCTAAASATVTVSNNATAAVTPANANICPGGSATFTASPASAYVWSNGSTTATITVSPLATTAYNVTVTTAGGCTATASGTVVVSNTLTTSITPQPDTICTGGSTILTAASGNSYLWSDGSTTGSITVSPGSTSNYSVTVSSGGTCTASASATVVVAPFSITINPASSNICAGQIIQLNCSYTSINTHGYTWSQPSLGNSQGVTANPGVTTTYGVTVSNGNNCTASASAVINVDVPSVTITPASPAVCAGQSTTLTASGASVYAWSNGAGAATNTVSPVVATKYIVTATDAGGCSITDSVVVAVGAMPTVTFTVTSPLCAGQNGTITYTGISSSAAVYTWNFNGGTISSGSGKGPYEVNWNTAGQQSVSLAVTDNGCVAVPDTEFVTVNAIPVAFAGNDTAYCNGASAVIGTTSTPGYTYLWSPVTGLSSSTVSNPTVSAGNPGGSAITQTYTVTASNNGCTASDSMILTVNPVPAALFAHQAAQCLSGNKFTFTALGTLFPSDVFAWTFGNNATPSVSTSQTQQVTYSSAQTTAVSLTITQTGCVSNTYVDSVTVNPMPVAAFSADTLTGCPGLDVCFVNTSVSVGNTGYQWNFGDGQTSTAQAPCHTFATPGTYTVNLSVTANGCSNDSANLNYIKINTVPVARFIPNVNTIQQPQSEIDFTNLSSNALTYLWNFGNLGSSTDINPSYNFTEYGLYNVVLNAYNIFGCSDSFTLPIRVLPPQSYFIPNVFTPNNDGNNDNFYIQSQEGVTVMEFTVFDRWGEKVHDGPFAWDGTYKGKPCPAGIYVYIFKLRLATNTEGIKRTGSVTLMR